MHCCVKEGLQDSHTLSTVAFACLSSVVGLVMSWCMEGRMIQKVPLIRACSKIAIAQFLRGNENSSVS